MDNTSWEEASPWYEKITAQQGHYYHKNIIFPGLLRIMNLDETHQPSILDLGCGPGSFALNLPKNVPYTGVDVSPNFIKNAKKRAYRYHKFLHSDVTKPLPLSNETFSHVLFILSLQNIDQPDLALNLAKKYLRSDGRLIIVLNHPCFRIPRQSSWEFDEKQKVQYRRVNRYLSPLKIPVQIHPGKNPEQKVWSYHHSLSAYSRFISDAGLCVSTIEEWCSDKKSYGKKAKIENRARAEFPLFLTIVAKS